MAPSQFRLSTFLMVIASLTIAIGMGYRNYVLKLQVVQLEAKVQALTTRCEKLTDLNAIKSSRLSPFRPRHPYESVFLENELQQFGIR